ncbi:MAG TPA: RraA family protein [Clostridiales bacterium]|nr:RraA family protein [Clostridiales bacterium]
MTENKSYQEENKELLKLYENFRVADVRDGMDWMGYHHYGTLDSKIRPLYRTKAVGIARTARYLPYEGPDPKVTGDEYTEWQGWYYNNVCTYPWFEEIEEGDFIVLDVSNVDVGLIGSDNSLSALYKGARGFVTNGGGIRDTDEVIMQRVPVWSYFVSQKMDQCRLQFDAKDVSVALGGVTINPGDIIIADGDGVLAVPRKIAYDVAKYANQELSNDKINRRKKYELLNWELDDTVQ